MRGVLNVMVSSEIIVIFGTFLSEKRNLCDENEAF